MLLPRGNGALVPCARCPDPLGSVGTVGCGRCEQAWREQVRPASAGKREQVRAGGAGRRGAGRKRERWNECGGRSVWVLVSTSSSWHLAASVWHLAGGSKQVAGDSKRLAASTWQVGCSSPPLVCLASRWMLWFGKSGGYRGA